MLKRISLLILSLMGMVLPSCAPFMGGGGSTSAMPQSSGPFALGIDRLVEDNFSALRGRRVGLITNQTSNTKNGVKTRVAMQRGLGRGLVALYTPEHGLDGTEKAGIHVSSRRDPLTGLIAYSLYGSTRKPTPAMLAGIDTLVFDLQDIGSRSYTYISTMAVAMEAAAENGKTFVVLDRPNPLGGYRVQGPPLESQWKSFVGQVPVPYVHGMTAGELAKMIAAEGWIKRSPKLLVVPMRGWNRAMTFRDTGAHWVATSPNIPRSDSPFYYATTGILGGLDGVDIGIGTSHPFEYAGGKGINGSQFAADMNRKGIPGVRFVPYTSSRKPGFGGVQIILDPHGQTDLMALDVILTSEVIRRSGGAPLRATRGDTLNLFHKVYGSASLWKDLNKGRNVGAIISEWAGPNNRFRSQRQRYLLY